MNVVSGVRLARRDLGIAFSPDAARRHDGGVEAGDA
jgi:hypothetical protein